MTYTCKKKKANVNTCKIRIRRPLLIPQWGNLHKIHVYDGLYKHKKNRSPVNETGDALKCLINK